MFKFLKVTTRLELEIEDSLDQINSISGNDAIKEWEQFIQVIKPIGAAANAIPLIALNQNKDIFSALKT